MKRDLYAEVSSRIVAELERSAAPWIKPVAQKSLETVPALPVVVRLAAITNSVADL